MLKSTEQKIVASIMGVSLLSALIFESDAVIENWWAIVLGIVVLLYSLIKIGEYNEKEKNVLRVAKEILQGTNKTISIRKVYKTLGYTTDSEIKLVQISLKKFRDEGLIPYDIRLTE